MRYVVELLLENDNFDVDHDYKVFDYLKDAEKRYATADKVPRNEIFREQNRTPSRVLRCRLYEVDAPTVRDAITMIRNGKGKLLEGTPVPTPEDIERFESTQKQLSDRMAKFKAEKGLK